MRNCPQLQRASRVFIGHVLLQSISGFIWIGGFSPAVATPFGYRADAVATLETVCDRIDERSAQRR
jgi:hypothetical protein